MNKIKVTLIGSFRKELDALRAIYDLLSESFDLLSPASIDFVDSKADFVKTKEEVEEDVHTIEEKHLEAIRQSDFVWLFCPSGYIGLSAAFEMGLAHSLGVPIYANQLPDDAMLQTMVTEVVASPNDVKLNVHKPGRGVLGLQRYYKRIAERRGWSAESPKDTMLLLTEELGELARAIRKLEGLKRDGGYDNVGLMDELADVQLYLVHLANGLSVDLDEAVTQKEKKNQQRHEKSS
jgi:NTP pyrophosphatase (non-canonical NTP hydrolase)/Fe-S-cluster formation regulator IscX/YfhJ